MKRFRADLFAKFSEDLGTIVGSFTLAETAHPESVSSQALSDTIKDTATVAFTAFQKELTELGLKASSITVGRILALLEQDNPTFGEVTELAVELKRRVTDELSGTLFYSLNVSEAENYNQSMKGWEGIIDRFPSTVLDIEESSKCVACSRYTASVFHLMRVIEVGLRALGIALKDPNLDPKRNPNWEDILRKCDAELQKPKNQRSPEWVADEDFFAEATATLRAVKSAWRNPTMHVEINYDEEKALDVRHNVRAFMRHLATKLKE